MSGPAPPVAATRRAVRAALADLEPGAVVLVACSGGADSLALAAAAAFESRRAWWRVGAVVVDHDLQADSSSIAAGVAATLSRLGLVPIEVVRVVVDLDSAVGPEAAARVARYAAIDEVADRCAAEAVLLGHTLDDQAETVLLGLARGSGARSLAGMRPRTGLLRRPLLTLDRATTERACAAQGLTPWVDPHNADETYARVRVRRSALPALESALGPGVAEALARTAELLRDDADALDAWSATARRDATADDGGLDCASLLTLPSAVRRRVLHTAALESGATHSALSHPHVMALDALVVDWHGQGSVALPGGVEGWRGCGRLYLRVAGEPSSNAERTTQA
ncbi:MAG: tRNA lysidine(34) synthetase TilS [Candidatus Nanopelagicales bacterium]